MEGQEGESWKVNGQFHLVDDMFSIPVAQITKQ
jgi:hypothetical protein